VKIVTWTDRERAALSALIRSGEPVDLTVGADCGRGRRANRNIRFDELVPLCRSIDFEDPSLAGLAKLFEAPRARAGRTERITAVIPCNRSSPIGVAALKAQDMDVEVLVLSNGHGPKTVDGARVISVDWKGHGATRALALEHVDTEFVFFSVDDALVLGEGCLHTLADALDDGLWDAAVARQIPWPDADAVTAARLRRWTPPGQTVQPMLQADHVATLYRTETLRALPIPDKPIAEDAWWSMGRRVAYVPTAPVLHSHVRSASALFRRNRDIHQQLVLMGHPPTIPSLAAVIGALPGVLRPSLSGGSAEVLNQLAEIVGQWQGARTAR